MLRNPWISGQPRAHDSLDPGSPSLPSLLSATWKTGGRSYDDWKYEDIHGAMCDIWWATLRFHQLHGWLEAMDQSWISDLPSERNPPFFDWGFSSQPWSWWNQRVGGFDEIHSRSIVLEPSVVWLQAVRVFTSLRSRIAVCFFLTRWKRHPHHVGIPVYNGLFCLKSAAKHLVSYTWGLKRHVCLLFRWWWERYGKPCLFFYFDGDEHKSVFSESWRSSDEVS